MIVLCGETILGIETQQPPAPTIFDQINGWFKRQDALLGYMAETQREILALLRALTGIPTSFPAVKPTPVSLVIPETSYPLPVIAEPLGRIRKFTPANTPIVTTASFAEVIGYAPTNDMEYDLANFAISADQDVLCKLTWGGNDFTQTFYVAAKIPFIQWVPPKYYGLDGNPVVGDGKSKLSLQAAMPSGGSATAYCYGELVGDEVTPPSS
jgi:hypothetical protein